MIKNEKVNILAYYHNLKFDGNFWLYFLLEKLKFKQAYFTLKKGEQEVIIWEDNRNMANKSFKYSISAKGQWYSITIKINNKIIELRDSVKLMPFTLSQIGESFKTKHKKLNMEYKGFRFAGCDISESELEYIKNDVLVLKEALEFMYSQNHNKLTIGACCLSEYKWILKTQDMSGKTFDRMFPNLEDFKLNPEKHFYTNADEWIRKTYKGGWCYVVKGKANKELRNGLTIDVNSLYPSMMSSESGNRYPIGLPYFWTGNYIPKEALKSDKYYFIHIKTRFYIKKGYLPFIQIKNSFLYSPTENLETSDYYDKKKKAYCRFYADNTGEVKDTKVDLYLTMTDYELIKEHYNLVDCEIIDGCYFATSCNLFDEYIEKYKDLKINSIGALRTLAKLFLNNLYGKLSTSPDSSFKVAYMKDNGVLGFYNQMEKNKETVFIACGSAVTSYARNFTIRTAQSNYFGPGKGGFAYADTDSCHLNEYTVSQLKGVNLHPSNFCCWKAESCWSRAIFVRQKTYIEYVTHEDLKKVTPYYNVKCAGMPDRCKELLVASLNGHTSNELLRKMGYSLETRNDENIKAIIDFVSVKRELTDFKVGLKVPAKLKPVRIKGGVILKEDFYTMRELW